MTESVLSIFDSDSKLGEELMSLTPPHDMDSLFPDLLELSESAMPSTTKARQSPVVSVEVMNQDLDLEQFLTGNYQNQMKPATRNSRIVKVERRNSVGQNQNQYGQLSPRSTEGDSDSTYGYSNSKCMTKSAIAARENRLKKKHHTEALENRVRNLSSENNELKTSVDGLSKTVKSLKTEVQYLKSIIANQSTLASLLQNIPGTPGVRLTSSEMSDTENQSPTQILQKRKLSKHDHDYASESVKKPKRECEDIKPGGVCLHVSGSSVSLEFCPTCSNKAASCK